MERNNSVCPFCGNEEVNSQTSPEVTDTVITVDLFCSSCQCKWKAIYVFSGIDIIFIPESYPLKF